MSDLVDIYRLNFDINLIPLCPVIFNTDIYHNIINNSVWYSYLTTTTTAICFKIISVVRLIVLLTTYLEMVDSTERGAASYFILIQLLLETANKQLDLEKAKGIRLERG